MFLPMGNPRRSGQAGQMLSNSEVLSPHSSAYIGLQLATSMCSSHSKSIIIFSSITSTPSSLCILLLAKTDLKVNIIHSHEPLQGYTTPNDKDGHSQEHCQ